MSSRRVVVTGMGIVSPVGNTLATAWDSICNGRSGIGSITHFDTSAYTAKIAGEVRDFDAKSWVNPKDAKKMDTFIHYGLAAAMMAMEDAGLEITEANAERAGVLIGSGIGGVRGIEETAIALHEGGPRKVSPFYVPSTIINMVSGQLCIIKGFKGPNFSAVSACASSNHSVGMAMRMIQYGDADIMVAGGAEHGCTPTSVAGFCSMKALSTRNDEPTRASRPWDRDRDGFVLGDGAGILILEEYDSAKARGARIYCELVGFGASSDAYHMTAPSENGEGPARCIAMALRDAKLNPDQVEYLNA
ncbi:MAG: beta-ketoacyl-ACP synthase II, partial [Gammaproteobacteria bacterium]|nr:beta-ketoacyl-ACP synthase II [Gammaproteobacteria bacterium]